MFERIEVQNFQRHAHRRVRFDPRVTCFTGVTDAGKSAIFRALRWLCRNRPSGEDFVSWGTDTCTVTLWADGHKIQRIRGKGVNTYALDGNDPPFAAFGTGVPEPIAAVLNVCDQNFQGQLDPPYWFLDTPGQVSRNLNTIVDLGVIDDTLANLATAARTAAATVAVVETRLAAAKADAAALAWVSSADADLRAVEALADKAAGAAVYAQTVAALAASVAQHTGRVAALGGAATTLRGVVAKCQAAGQAGKRAMAVAALVADIKALTVTAGRRPPDIRPLGTLLGKANATETRLSALRSAIAGLVQAANAAKMAKAVVQAARDDFKQQTGGVCPICERPMV